uniref:Uncharacterized protein n=1 Tax=Globodera rostochiensis TaxID=31243 RepID=A0A914H327_GLORO
MLCDEQRFIGEKDADLANIKYTGGFPTAHKYKLAGLNRKQQRFQRKSGAFHVIPEGDMKIILITIFCVAPWVCFGLRCKFNEKIPGYWTEIVNCQTDEHYCAAANCTAFWSPEVITHFTSWGCFNSTDSQKCSELFTARSYVDEKYTCDPCVIGEKDVDLANENFTRVLRCKRGEEAGPWNHTEIVECNDGSHFCVAASCIYLKKAVFNVTKWDCSSHYGIWVESAFINLLLVMLTFVMAILCRF